MDTGPLPSGFVPLASSNLRGAGYDPATQSLTIHFRSGHSYTYSGVPADVFTGLLRASSPGSYFHANIKDSYSYE